MTKKFNQYLGKAGHLVVMSEFLIRGWNVAIPEVDVGDDIFVVKDENGELRRVQVKTSTAAVRKRGISGQFNLSYKQLSDIREVIIHYVFILRTAEGWTAPIIIRQDILFDLIENKNIGSVLGDRVVLYLSISENVVRCNAADFTQYLNNFADFGKIEH